MTSLEDIGNKYLKDMTETSKYMESVKQMFLSLCYTFDGHDELPVLLQAILTYDFTTNYQSLVNELTSLQETIQKRIMELGESENSNSGLSPFDGSMEGDLLLCIHIEISKGNRDREALFQACQGIIEAWNFTKGSLIYGDEVAQLSDNKDLVYSLIDVSLKDASYREKVMLQKRLISLSKLIICLELFDTQASVNVYRQSFIQTMAFFDTCIFDLFRTCMKKDYFSWLKYFKNSTIKTQEMSERSSFEDFLNWHIDELLRGCYVKDLLNILKCIDPTIFDDNGKDTFAEVQETIARRNAHLHNNGIVDGVYTSNFNIYNLQEGDYLAIDSAWVEKVQKLTQNVVNNIVTKFS